MSETTLSKTGDEWVANFPDGSRAVWPGSTSIDVIKKNIRETLLARAQPVSPDVSSLRAAQQAASETGSMEALAIAGGRSFDKLAMGLKQATLAGIRSAAPKSFSDAANVELRDLSRSEAEKDSLYSPLAQNRPISTAIGEALPAIAIPGSIGTLPMALTYGGIEAAKYGDPQERIIRGLIGAGASFAGSTIGRGAAHALSPGKSLSETQRAALSGMEKMQVQPRLSQVTGSPFVARLEDFAARVPGGAGVMAKFDQTNKQAINRVAAASIGQNADELTAGVFANAREQLSKVFEEIKGLGKVNVNGRQVLPIKIDKSVSAAADDVLRVQGKLPPGMQNPSVIAMATDAKRMAGLGARIDGEAYQLIRSNLTDASHSAFTAGDSTMGRAYDSLLGALDNSADASLRAAGKSDLAQALKRVRPMYGNLVTLEKGMVAEGGNVSPARVAQALRTRNPAAFREGGGGALGEIGRFGEAFKPLQAGSPTFERSLTQSPVATALVAPFAWGAARATTSPVMTGIPRLIATGGPAVQNTANLLGDIADPAVRAAVLGLLQRPAVGLLGSAPVMAE